MHVPAQADGESFELGWHILKTGSRNHARARARIRSFAYEYENLRSEASRVPKSQLQKAIVALVDVPSQAGGESFVHG